MWFTINNFCNYNLCNRILVICCYILMLNIIIFKCISDTSSLSSYSIDFHVNKAYCCYVIGAYLFHWGMHWGYYSTFNSYWIKQSMMWRNRRGLLRPPSHAKKLNSFKTKFKLCPLNLASFPKIYQDHISVFVTCTSRLMLPWQPS